MKCSSCSCQVSQEFKHSIETNICPKCGDALLDAKVKGLLLQMQSFLAKDDRDLSDLAAWVLRRFSNENPDQAEDETDAKEAGENSDVIPAPKKVRRSGETLTPQDQGEQLLDPTRAELFAKRAGVQNKIKQTKGKYEQLIKDIQGAEDQEEGLTSYMDPEDNDPYPTTQYTKPLAPHEMGGLDTLFDLPPELPMDMSELRKIQRLEEMGSMGSVGKIRRAD